VGGRVSHWKDKDEMTTVGMPPLDFFIEICGGDENAARMIGWVFCETLVELRGWGKNPIAPPPVAIRMGLHDKLVTLGFLRLAKNGQYDLNVKRIAALHESWENRRKYIQ
jgi:hypothetical protein